MYEVWSDRVRRFIGDHFTITRPSPSGLQCWFGIGPVGTPDGSSTDGVSVIIAGRQIAVHRNVRKMAEK